MHALFLTVTPFSIDSTILKSLRMSCAVLEDLEVACVSGWLAISISDADWLASASAKLNSSPE